jgi:hypothetical protein
VKKSTQNPAIQPILFEKDKNKMAKKTANTEIVPSTPTQVQTIGNELPEYLREFAGMGAVGLEQISQEDTVMPRLAIAQNMSPQVDKTKPLFIPSLETGDFFNTVTNEIYGPGPLLVTPLFVFKSRIFFAPRGAQGPQQLCSTRAVDEDGRLILGPITPEGCNVCPHSAFLETPRADGSTRPDCTMFYNYVCAVHKTDNTMEPVVFSAKSKMIKPAKKWNSMVRYRQPRLPMFTMLFELATTPETAPKGTFFNFSVQNAGNVSPELIQQSQGLFEMLSNRDIKIDMRGVEEEIDADVIDTDSM